MLETTPEAIKFFQQSLEQRPYDQRVLGNLCVFEILMGRHEDARLRVRTAQMLFPDDPTFSFLLGFSYGLEGDLAKAEAQFDLVEEQFGIAAKFQAIESLKAWNQFTDLILRFDQLTWVDNLKVLGIITKLSAISRLRTQGITQMAMQSPQSLRNIFIAMIGWLKVQNNFASHGDRVTAAHKLEQAIQGHPEGFLLFFTGIALISIGELEEGPAASRNSGRISSPL